MELPPVACRSLRALCIDSARWFVSNATSLCAADEK